MFPGDDGYPGSAAMNAGRWRSSRRAPALVWQLSGRARACGRGGARFYDTPHLFFNTRFANNPPWGAQITLTESGRRLHRSVPELPGRQPVPGARHRLGDVSRFRLPASTSNAPLDTKPTSLQQWNLGAQRQLGDWLVYGELPRQSLEPPVARDRAELRGVRPGRDHREHQRSAGCWSCRIPRRARSTAPSASWTTPAVRPITACCSRRSGG